MPGPYLCPGLTSGPGSAYASIADRWQAWKVLWCGPKKDRCDRCLRGLAAAFGRGGDRPRLHRLGSGVIRNWKDHPGGGEIHRVLSRVSSTCKHWRYRMGL